MPGVKELSGLRRLVTTEELLERRYRVLGRGSPLFYDQPLHLVRGEGVLALGRRRPALSRRVQQRPARRSLSSARRRGDRAPGCDRSTRTRATCTKASSRYAERLTVAVRSASSSMAFLACTGSEANEIALRMATVCTGSPRHHLHEVRVPRQHDGSRADQHRVSAARGLWRAHPRHRPHRTRTATRATPRGALSPAAWLPIDRGRVRVAAREAGRASRRC